MKEVKFNLSLIYLYAIGNDDKTKGNNSMGRLYKIYISTMKIRNLVR